MLLIKGKAGLLASVLWALAGAVILNDRPILPSSAVSLLQAANTERGVLVLDKGFHAGLLGGKDDITRKGPSALRLPEMHTVVDILKSLSAITSGGLSKKPWQFWS